MNGNTLSAMGYGYDTRGRLASVSEPGIVAGGFTADFGYLPNSDLPHNTTSKAAASTKLTGTRGYDNANRLDSIGYVRPGNTIVTSHGYTLDAVDRRTRAVREDGTAWDYDYNSRDEVTSAVKQLANTNLLSGWQQEFGYDNLGNRKFTRESGDANGANRRQLDYKANNLNQYTEISHPSAIHVLGKAPANVTVTVNTQAVVRQGEYWSKELVGLPNALAAVWQPVSVEAVDPGAGLGGSNMPARRSGHRFVPAVSESPYYDEDGNLVSHSLWVYEWNGENQLIEMTTAAPAVAAGVPQERYRYGYDSRHRRIARTVESWNANTGVWVLETSEQFVYDNWNVVAVINAVGGVVQRYAWGNDLSGSPQGAGGVGGLLVAKDTASGRSWCYAYDGNGNVSAVVDLPDGTNVGRYDYDAFGRTIATWGDEALAEVNGYGLSTKSLEGTGLYYYGFRYYMPESGRWAGRDPIGERGGINLYGFVGNGSVNGVDFLGLVDPDVYLGGEEIADHPNFIFVAKSFINGPYPVGGKPRNLFGVPDIDTRYQLFAATADRLLAAFNENPITDARDGKYRLYSKIEVHICCANSKIKNFKYEKSKEGGQEIGSIYGTISLDDSSSKGMTKAAIEWEASGRPASIVEPGMQLLDFRTSRIIWHKVFAIFSCNGDTPEYEIKSFSGSQFPSHRLWEGGEEKDFKSQGNLSDLWEPDPSRPDYVR